MITSQFRKRVKKWFYAYKTLLMIPKYWRLSINVDEKIKCYAEVSYDYQDKKFDIKINPKLNQDLPDLKDSILHELLHILFTPATSRLDLMISKLECNEKVNFKRTKKNMAMYEEWLVRHIAKVIISQEKE
jgi:hypothetical protein